MISPRFVLDFLVCFVSLLWEGLIRYGEEFDERGRRKKNAMRMNAKEKQGRVNERVITFESKNLQELFFMDRRCMKKVKITCNLHF